MARVIVQSWVARSKRYTGLAADKLLERSMEDEVPSSYVGAGAAQLC